MSESIEDEDNNNSNTGYVLSIDDNDLVVYKGDDKYVCKKCISPKTKKTKRLLCAIKRRANLSIRITNINTDSDTDIDTDNNNSHHLELRVLHPLFDDDVYIMYDKDIANIMYESSSVIESALVNTTTVNTTTVNNNADSKPLCYIYVLFLEQDKYYIGKSLKPMSRTGDHLAATIFDKSLCGSSSGSGWTRMYPPVKILEVTPSYDEFDEDRFALRYMKNKGIDNVRGGSFCELNLSRENVVTLEKMLAGAGDKCYYCGSSDHFINACPQKNMRRIPQKQRKTTVKAKDMPKSKILKYYGTTQLLKNSDLNTTSQRELVTKQVLSTTSQRELVTKQVLSTTPKPHNDDNCVNNENFVNNNGSTPLDESGESKSFQCRYCYKNFTSAHTRNNHENLLCTKSAKVIKGKMIEADVDAILEANKKYIKNKDDKIGNKKHK